MKGRTVVLAAILALVFTVGANAQWFGTMQYGLEYNNAMLLDGGGNVAVGGNLVACLKRIPSPGWVSFVFSIDHAVIPYGNATLLVNPYVAQSVETFALEPGIMFDVPIPEMPELAFYRFFLQCGALADPEIFSSGWVVSNGLGVRIGP